MRALFQLPDGKKELDLREGVTIYEALVELRLNSDSCVVFLDNKPVPEDILVKNGKEYTVVIVASGG
ncbi:MAG TPA: hypothetical protein ENN76_00120 [Euryarchaeota archaeon]|nr:hypothetical protein [Euryarchaeota archaeon]